MNFARSKLIEERRRALQLPFEMKRVLEKALNSLSASRESRSWTVPETSFREEIDLYQKEHSLLKQKSPCPKLRTSISDAHAIEMAVKVRASLNFIELGQQADPIVKPILLYYGCIHLVGVWARSFFEWKNDKHSHGLAWSRGNYLDECSVLTEVSGSFARAAVSCYIFKGQVGCFTPLVTFRGRPTEHTRKGGLLENFGVHKTRDPLKVLSLRDLADYAPLKTLNEINKYFGLHKNDGLPTTLFLLDIITLFMASSMARYDILRWKEVLDGETNNYRLHFEDVFDRVSSFSADLLLSLLEDPTSNFKRNLVYGFESPYSRYPRFF